MLIRILFCYLFSHSFGIMSLYWFVVKNSFQLFRIIVLLSLDSVKASTSIVVTGSAVSSLEDAGSFGLLLLFNKFC